MRALQSPTLQPQTPTLLFPPPKFVPSIPQQQQQQQQQQQPSAVPKPASDPPAPDPPAQLPRDPTENTDDTANKPGDESPVPMSPQPLESGEVNTDDNNGSPSSKIPDEALNNDSEEQLGTEDSHPEMTVSQEPELSPKEESIEEPSLGSPVATPTISAEELSLEHQDCAHHNCPVPEDSAEGKSNGPLADDNPPTEVTESMAPPREDDFVADCSGEQQDMEVGEDVAEAEKAGTDSPAETQVNVAKEQ